MPLPVVFDRVAEVFDRQPDRVQGSLQMLQGGLPMSPQPLSLLLKLLKVCRHNIQAWGGTGVVHGSHTEMPS